MKNKKTRVLPLLFLGASCLLTTITSAGYSGGNPCWATEVFKPEIHQFGLPLEAIYTSQATNPAIGYTQARGFLDTPRYSLEFQQVGKIETNLSSGSGTVIRPRTILTAGHLVYFKNIGFVNQVKFKRNFNGGPRHVPTGGYSIDTSENSNIETKGVKIWTSYKTSVDSYGATSISAFRDDFSLVYYNSFLSRGRASGYGINIPDTTNTPPSLKVTVGYGGEDGYDGTKPLATWTYTALTRLSGFCWSNPNVRAYRGMSGGPLFQRQHGDSVWYVRGVLVGYVFSNTCYRMIDQGVFDFINSSP